jgi:hypothetical protein
MRAALFVASLIPLLVSTASPVTAQTDGPPPLQIAERSLTIGMPDSTTTYGCITTGMHPGQGVVGPGYDAVTYSITVTLQIQPGNDTASQANANMEGLACRIISRAGSPE